MEVAIKGERDAGEDLHSFLADERIEGKHKVEQLSPDEIQLQWGSPLYTIEANGDENVNWIPSSHIEQNACDAEINEKHLVIEEPVVVDGTYDQKPQRKKPKRHAKPVERSEETKLEENAQQVKERFRRGCECQDESCFRGLNPESVYKHRLNIAELTKAEHDMYLMGVTMACLANPDTTIRQKERQRLRAQYVYQGRRVCLDAFLYLENCTHYQLKRIRKHVMTHGVAPRVHGNHGKKPHNTFSLGIYQHATKFIKHHMDQYASEQIPGKLHVQLPSEVTRKNMHDAYKKYAQVLDPGTKLMGYSTFRHFMKEQFPHVRFTKIEPKASHPAPSDCASSQPSSAATTTCTISQPIITNATTSPPQNSQLPNVQLSNCIIGNKVQQVIPLVVAQNHDGSAGAQTFIVTPVPHLITNNTGVANANPSSSTLAYQLSSTGYVINEQGGFVAQPTSFKFNRV